MTMRYTPWVVPWHMKNNSKHKSFYRMDSFSVLTEGPDAKQYLFIIPEGTVMNISLYLEVYSILSITVSSFELPVNCLCMTIMDIPAACLRQSRMYALSAFYIISGRTWYQNMWIIWIVSLLVTKALFDTVNISSLQVDVNTDFGFCF